MSTCQAEKLRVKSAIDIKLAIRKWESLGCPDTVKKYQKLIGNGPAGSAAGAAAGGRHASKSKHMSILDDSPKKKKYVPPGEREVSTGASPSPVICR